METSNPLLAAQGGGGDFRMKKRWYEDTVFRNQAKDEPAHVKRFINGPLLWLLARLTSHQIPPGTSSTASSSTSMSTSRSLLACLGCRFGGCADVRWMHQRLSAATTTGLPHL
jgi:hypothetical protein